jgi:hypothetical protein
MYEFDSVSVSSFEAASLASALTEKAADGWSVAGIVTAGSDVVAYLQRAIDTATDDAAAAETGTGTGAAEPATDTSADPAALIVAASAEPAATAAGTTASEPASTTAAETAAGWAASGTASTSGGWNGQSSADTSSASTSSWGGSSQQAPATQPAATPQVPAGWYADPAGRFELRYWDGGSWTEHVSRAGQQYTDPPVA